MCPLFCSFSGAKEISLALVVAGVSLSCDIVVVIVLLVLVARPICMQDNIYARPLERYVAGSLKIMYYKSWSFQSELYPFFR